MDKERNNSSGIEWQSGSDNFIAIPLNKDRIIDGEEFSKKVTTIKDKMTKDTRWIIVGKAGYEVKELVIFANDAVDELSLYAKRKWGDPIIFGRGESKLEPGKIEIVRKVTSQMLARGYSEESNSELLEEYKDFLKEYYNIDLI